MIAKMNRSVLFFSLFISNFIILLLVFSLYFYAERSKYWFGDFFTIKLFHLPFIVYLIAISMVISLLVLLISYIIRREQYGRLEEKLRLLANGNYDNSALLNTIQMTNQDLYLPEIEEEIQMIRQKLINMSKELQCLNNVPQLVDGQTKEEILQEERHRLARELHDSVSQQLFAATMLLSSMNEMGIEQQLPDIFQKQLETVTHVINESQSEMRALLLHLRPINLEGKSLLKGIEQLLVELQTKIEIKITWDMDDIILDTGMEDHLFRIVQELLSNTLRHAKAQSLELYLKKVGQVVLLRVVDDGIGFDMHSQKVGSYGLQNIQERVQGMGGSCRIISFLGKGSSVEIKIPVMDEEGGALND